MREQTDLKDNLPLGPVLTHPSVTKVKKLEKKKKNVKKKKKVVKIPKPKLKVVQKKAEEFPYIIRKIIIKSKKKKEPILEVLRITEPNFKGNKLVVSYYLNFYKPLSQIFFNEKLPKGAKVTFNFPESVTKTSENINGIDKQVWKIIPEISKSSYKFGYICQGKGMKDELPMDITIPKQKISVSKEKSAKTEKLSFFLPELHQHLQQVVV